MDCSASTQIANAASHVVCIMQPADWRIYITPLLVAVSAAIASVAIWNTRAVARQKATLDLIEKTESTEHYRTLNETFSGLRLGSGFGHLHNPTSEDSRVQRQAVADYLNHYELVSIGILANILDQKIYRKWMEGPFIRDWNAAAPFIQRERWKCSDDGNWSYYKRHFENYQILATRWSQKAIVLNERYSDPPPSDKVAPTDEPLPIPSEDEGTATPDPTPPASE